MPKLSLEQVAKIVQARKRKEESLALFMDLTSRRFYNTQQHENCWELKRAREVNSLALFLYKENPMKEIKRDKEAKDVLCKGCNKPFTQIKSFQKFCSVPCRTKWHNSKS